MSVTTIERDYRIAIPEPLRQGLKIGDELVVELNPEGRLVLVPARRIAEILDRTAGLWRSHRGEPDDGVVYVNNLRSGRRLAEQRDEGYEAD